MSLHALVAAKAAALLHALVKAELRGTDQATATLDGIEVTISVRECPATTLSAAEQAVLEALRTGPLSLRQLASKSGYSYDHIRRNVVPNLETCGRVRRARGRIELS